MLTKIKGIGRWSAEIYLLFAEGRGDVFPAGDLAVLVEIGRLMGLPEKPSEKQLRVPKPGGRIAARRPCSPGTAIIRRFSRS